MIAITFFVLSPSAAEAAGDLGGYRFTRISAAEQAAVVETPDGDLQLVRAGDRLTIAGQDGTVRELEIQRFEDGRAILETEGEWGRATWIVEPLDGQQQISVMEVRPLTKTMLISVGGGR